MRKIFGIAVVALIIIGGVSYFVLFTPGPSEKVTDEYFFSVLDEFPWVRYAQRQQSEKELLYYNEISTLYSRNKRIGFTLINIEWIRDYISKDEALTLSLLVSISELDPDIALSIVQSFWFQNGVTSTELNIIEDILTMTEQNIQVARNVASTDWFIIGRATKIEEMVRAINDLPLDLALSVSVAPWFSSDLTLTEVRVLPELSDLYREEKDLALFLPEVYESQDFSELQRVVQLYRGDKELAESFMQYNTYSKDSFLALSALASIAEFNRELAQSFIDELTKDDVQALLSLADIYSYSEEMGEFAGEKFRNSRIALRYMQKVLEADEVSPELMEWVVVFITANPEFVYEDRIEPYRYHLLTQIISELPVDTAQEYKNLIYVACSVYGSRFYSWQNPDYGVLEGWSSDRQLDDLEKEAVMNFLSFLIEKNEQGVLSTDLRLESHDYLYGVLSIPFTHPVNLEGPVQGLISPEGPIQDMVPLDGIMVETTRDEPGTYYVLTTIYNINTLERRFSLVEEKIRQMNQAEYLYSNPVVDLILREGEKRDRLFLYFCTRNWEQGVCVDQTMHTRMDSIVMGISTTAMQWEAPDAAHMYPAYIPSNSLAEKIQLNPAFYGNPFVYKGFIAPYDEAGFKDSLDRDIEEVRIYDPQAEREVGLFNKMAENMIFDEKVVLVVLVGLGVIIIVLADIFKLLK
ncbi:MAG: hypothetical protein HXS44_15175 [Theionarchaea archaeon]|nr:hypothetical protein [Theionarchaea archaeon]